MIISMKKIDGNSYQKSFNRNKNLYTE